MQARSQNIRGGPSWAAVVTTWTTTDENSSSQELVMATEFLVPLRSDLDAASVGAKAANLGKVIALGLSVPPGAAISRKALRLFLEENRLAKRAQRLIDGGLDETRRAAEYATLCDAILDAPIPRQVTAAAADCVRSLLHASPTGIAVRSSAVHEDSDRASFAGVYDSFLGIRTQSELWSAVRRCWSKLWDPNSLNYARRMGVHLEVDGMGVLLQELVPADSAGVLFTADPITGNPWRFVLESCFGLARDLVASTGAADRFLIAWDSSEVLDSSVAVKEHALIIGRTGIEQTWVSEARQAEPSLSVEQATQIGRIGLQIDRGPPCAEPCWTQSRGTLSPSIPLSFPPQLRSRSPSSYNCQISARAI